METAAHENFRYLTSDLFDIDAFYLTSQVWIFFIYVKDPTLLKKNNFMETASKFPKGRVIGMGRALKTKKISKPLPWMLLNGGKRETTDYWCLESSIKYRLEVDSVLNPGLFLDQAPNRKRLSEHIRILCQKGNDPIHVLNLFSYTGSFSVVASCAGATHTTSVDVSNRYLKWEHLNHDANAATEAKACRGKPIHRLICEDARVFLKKEVKRKASYHCIILDPPTFSRGKEKVLNVQKEFFPMLENASKCLAKKGMILASTNDASWTRSVFFKEIENFAKKTGFLVVPGHFPKEFGKNHSLKSAWLLSSK